MIFLPPPPKKRETMRIWCHNAAINVKHSFLFSICKTQLWCHRFKFLIPWLRFKIRKHVKIKGPSWTENIRLFVRCKSVLLASTAQKAKLEFSGKILAEFIAGVGYMWPAGGFRSAKRNHLVCGFIFNCCNRFTWPFVGIFVDLWYLSRLVCLYCLGNCFCLWISMVKL